MEGWLGPLAEHFQELRTRQEFLEARCKLRQRLQELAETCKQLRKYLQAVREAAAGLRAGAGR